MTTATAGAALLAMAMAPLVHAWRGAAGTTLRHALVWAGLALAVWVAAMGGSRRLPEAAPALRYLALVLTGCAGVSVLGSRRPGAAAWHFVTLGLMLVLLMPVAEGWGHIQLSPPRILFVAGTLAVAFLNYLPTRLGMGAVLMAGGCAVELIDLTAGPLRPGVLMAGRMLLAVGPWAAWLAVWRAPPTGSEFDRIWRTFRDRFGGLWALRLRDQFNRAAANAGWTATLSWRGLHPAHPPEEGPATAMLRAILKRFGHDQDDSRGPTPAQ